MFTGIVGHIGRFRGFRQGKKEMAVEAPGLGPGIAVGDSVAVNGVCLSVIRKDGGVLFFNLSRETLDCSTMGILRPGAEMNLETPLTLAAPLGGHLVSGHVDFTSRLLRLVPKKPGRRLVFSLPSAFKPYFVTKGSVAVDGVSLTVAALEPASFEVEIIPLTLEKTSLGRLKGGDVVNVECDMIGKYVYNWITRTQKSSSRTEPYG